LANEYDAAASEGVDNIDYVLTKYAGKSKLVAKDKRNH